MYAHLALRERGQHAPCSLRGKERLRWRYSLTASSAKHLQSTHTGIVTALSLDHAERRYLLSSGAEGALQIVDIHTLLEPSHEVFAPVVHVPPARRIGGYACATWYPHDSGAFVSLAFSGEIRLWDTNTQEVVMTKDYASRGSAAAFSPCATSHYLLAVCTADQSVRLMDLRSGMDTWTLVGHRNAVLCAQWSPSEPHTLVTGSADASVRLWDIRKPNGASVMFDLHKAAPARKGGEEPPQKRARLEYPDPFQRSKQALQRAHHGAVTGVCFLPDGDSFVSTGNDHRMRMWNCDGSLVSVNFPGIVNASKLPTQIATSADGRMIYHGNGNDIGAYLSETGERVFDLVEHFGAVQCVLAHPEHEALFSGAKDGSMVVWTPELVEARVQGADGSYERTDDVSEWSE